jgi:hypothetical protein
MKRSLHIKNDSKTELKKQCTSDLKKTEANTSDEE